MCLFQCSHEAPLIFTLLQLTFSGEEDGEQGFARLKQASGVAEADWTAFLVYAAAFYANMGNCTYVCFFFVHQLFINLS